MNKGQLSLGCQACPSRQGILERRGEDLGNNHYTIALCGNPNTGKSTVFNNLTGLKQHTGNWPGKTVGKAEGAFAYRGANYRIVDLPGTYSLSSTSEDEEIARDYILFGSPDVTIIVADATRLERNMNLILQVLQITDRAILCVNLLDEAKRNQIDIDLLALGRRLGIPVVGASARSWAGMDELLSTIHQVVMGQIACSPKRTNILPQEVMTEVARLQRAIEDEQWQSGQPLQGESPSVISHASSLWIAFRLLERDPSVLNRISSPLLLSLAEEIHLKLGDNLHEQWVEGMYAEAEQICSEVVTQGNRRGRSPLDVRLDRILTSRLWGFPIMIGLLALVFWLTIVGSNYPSGWLNELLVGYAYPVLRDALVQLGSPSWITGLLIDGIYLSTAWVVSVMLPPMAIFFPLFTLLEDFGYLPRVAFNLDELFRRSGAHGKQALTMSMGFGCNAAGVVSTRIIDSNRERLIAIITNNFSLCNGRWPTQILLGTLFIGAIAPSGYAGIVSMGSVLGVVLLGVGLMFASSWMLSRTVLRGEVSTFHLELPPYRPPQFWRTLYTSLIDRTLIVLWRAILFAAPAGALIWLSCNITVSEGRSLAELLIGWLDAPGWVMGLNGIILLAYVLAIPANEIVLPTILMLTLLIHPDLGSGVAGILIEGSPEETKELLVGSGWTTLTAINLMLFCLLHNPCSTTIYTIYKETGSLRWTALASLLPLALGIVLTSLVAFFWRILV
ncbi:MAG: ferrous iron transport protein B [Porphyromonadaceae bacterium]|nr:ferrous iron transport protein B [Porphyromonadaceae bacterium]